MKNNTSPFVTPYSIWLIVLTISLGLIIGASILIFPTSFAPAIIFALMAMVIAILVWVQKPILALYFSIFVVLLPANLIPPEINSMLNRATTVFAAVVWILDLIRHKQRVKVPITTLLMILFIVWSAISLVWAQDRNIGATVLQTYILRLILFLILIVNQIQDKKTLNGLLNTIALSGWLLVFVSGVEFIVNGYVPGTRFQVLSVNENTLGIKLLLTIPAMIWWATKSPSNFSSTKKLLAGIFLIVSLGLTGLSGSRGSAISMAIAILILLVFRPTWKWGLMSVLILGIAAVVAPFIFSTTINRFLVTPGDLFLGGREYIWPAGWQMINNHLFIGVGIGNSPFLILPYLQNQSAIWIDSLEGSLHNPLMAIWADTGLVGLVFYFGALASAVISFSREYLKSRASEEHILRIYFPVITAISLGFLASWIKGGGMESDFSYFLILSFLLIPANINNQSNQN